MFNITLNTFKEIFRNKIFSMILIFAFLFLIFSISLSKLTIWDTGKILIDFGLGLIEIIGIISVLFVWSQLLYNEIQGKTIFLILSKPIKKYQFLLWKFFGFSLILGLITLVQSLVFLAILLLNQVAITDIIIWSLINTFLKLELLLALVFFFSTFMSNIMSIISAILIYLLSHSISLLIDIAISSKNELFIVLSKVINTILPPLQSLNTKDIIGTISSVPLSTFIFNFIHSLIFITFLLFLTIIIFNKRKFEE